jgi:3-deoxy-D-manno-octulosonate 8-phosphate phosphatase (KDO 8-P phosphatase)
LNQFLENIDYIRSQDSSFPVLDTNSTWEEITTAFDESSYDLSNALQYNLNAQALNWNSIKLVLLDVDGVMTEGGMFYTESGDEFKRFDTKDGMAIKHGMKSGIEFGIISSGINTQIIEHRAQMFGIERVYVGTEKKLAIAEKWLEEMNLEWQNVGYIGDDVNDIQLFDRVGICAAPSDATNPIKEASDFVLNSTGGHGCIREFMRYHPELKGQL